MKNSDLNKLLGIGPGGINCGCCVDYPKKRKNSNDYDFEYSNRPKYNYYNVPVEMRNDKWFIEARKKETMKTIETYNKQVPEEYRLNVRLGNQSFASPHFMKYEKKYRKRTYGNYQE